MKDLVRLQLMIICLSWFVALAGWGLQHAVSVLLGGVTYFLPTLLSIIVLTKIRRKLVLIPIVLVIVEAHKIMLVVVIMTIVYLFFPNVNWMSYVVGLILVTQVGLLMFRKSFYYE